MDTDFAGRSFVLSVDPEGGPYGSTVEAVLTAFAGVQQQGQGSAADVADAIFAAVTDDSPQLRYIVGDDATAMLGARQAMDDGAFMGMIRGNFGLAPDPM